MFDRWLPPSQDHQPLTWWRQQPVFLSAILALVAAGSIIVTALLGPHAAQLVFTSEAFFKQAHLWVLLTYPLINFPSVWVVIGCFLLWRFGESVERHIGRRAFVGLLLLLLIVPPVIISLFGVTGFASIACAGIMALEFAVFIAFATLYPTAQVCMIIITFDAWVLAAVLAGVQALERVAYRDWTGLLVLVAEIGTAYLFIQHSTGRLSLPELPHRAPKSTKPGNKPAPPAPPTVDQLLEKISRNGIHSLNAEERLILDKASDELRRRAR